MKKLILLVFIAVYFNCEDISGQDTNTLLFNKIDSAFNSQDYELILANKNDIIKYANQEADSISAELLYYLGDAFLAYDKLSEALEVMQKELAVREKLPNADQIMIADIQFNLGFYLQLDDQFNESKDYYFKASELYRDNFGTENAAYIESQIELAKVYGILEEHRRSMELLESLLKINLAKDQYQHVINKELGMAYYDIGYYSKSENILNKNLEFIRSNFGKESIEYAEGLVTLAIPYYYRSRYSEAELLYTEALKITEKLASSNLLKETTQNNLALLYWKIGLYDQSVSLFRKIISDEKTVANAISYNNYAHNLLATDKKDSAIAYINKSLIIIEKELGKNNELYIRHLKEKAQMLRQIDDLVASKNLMKESYDSSQEILEKSNPEYSKYELNWGIANFRVNDIDKAEKHIKTAHKLRSKYLSEKHPLHAETGKRLAELNWYKNNPKKAKEYFQETFNNYFSQIEAYFPALSEQQKANFYANTLRSTFEEFNSFAISFKDQDPSLLGNMYDYQLATKGLIMYATAKARKNIMNSDDEALKSKYQDWIYTKELISQLYSMSEAEIAQQELKLDSLINKSNEMEKELSRASSEFADAFASKNYTWKDVQKELKENEAAIEMIRFRKFVPDSSGMFLSQINYAALLIDKKSKEPELILLENGQELENKYIKNYRNAIRYKVKDKYSYEFFWKPIAEKTEDYNKVYFSPDGIYNQISLNVLYNNETEKYVLEEQNIQLLTNTKDLIAFSQNKSSSNLASNPTLFGFPNYNKGIIQNKEIDLQSASDIVENASLNRGLRGSLQRYIRGNSLVTALPGTKEEVDKINKLYNSNEQVKPNTYLENEADENQLKSVKNPKVLHIATHGFFLEDNEATEDQEEEKYTQNPLLKSGLIMAGANSFISSGTNTGNQQDGILTAYEAMNLNLNDTELVVLSACETGLGEVKNGEGVYGLRRAFYVAGADAIIMSLWSVDDDATQELMTTFYQNWIGGEDKLSAFNNAQKFVKDKYEAPFYWGAFVMVGQ